MTSLHTARQASGNPLTRGLVALACGLAVLAGVQAHAATVSPPPAAQLSYHTKVAAKGMSVTIDSRIEWQPDGKRYRVVNSASHLLLGNLAFDSQGQLGPNGLMPEVYKETRRKRVKEVHIDRSKDQVRFSGGQVETAPAGLQDRTSVMLQLSSLARGNASAFEAGKTLQIPVAGSSKVQTWTFEVVGETTLDAPMGALRTVHVKRLPRPDHDDDDQTVDVWLAVEHDWLPARVRLRETNGDVFDQVVAEITR